MRARGPADVGCGWRGAQATLSPVGDDDVDPDDESPPVLDGVPLSVLVGVLLSVLDVLSLLPEPASVVDDSLRVLEPDDERLSVL